jgi:hypothetical protein
MSQHPQLMPPPTQNTPLSLLAGWWIVASCCGATKALPCPSLDLGGGWTVDDVVRRLLCQRCGNRLAEASLRDRTDAGGAGGPTKWVEVAISRPIRGHSADNFRVRRATRLLSH